MTRLPRLSRPDLDQDQLALFERVTRGYRETRQLRFPRVGPDDALDRPFNAMLFSPRLGMALQEVGAQVRFHSSLTDRCRELAILTVATAWDSAYERFAHEQIARNVGLDDEDLTAVRTGSAVRLTDPTERVVLEATRLLVSTGDLDDPQYETVVDILGERGVFELVTLVGYYSLTALALRVFRVFPPGTH